MKCGRFRGRTIVLIVASCCALFLVSRGYSSLVDDSDKHIPQPETINGPPKDSGRRRAMYIGDGNFDNNQQFKPNRVNYQANNGIEMQNGGAYAQNGAIVPPLPAFAAARGGLRPVPKQILDNADKLVITNSPKDKIMIGDIVVNVRGSKQQIPYPNLKKGKFIPPNTIVHFDLKGAALKVPYFNAAFKLIKELNGTGVLLEWEDMFPYEGVLEVTKHGQAYTKEDIRTILKAAASHGLSIIPLVQTFGHLEWILKHPQFAKYRQVEKYAQVICLADNDAVNLVRDAVSQVLTMHLEVGLEYFHMGADEAFQVGMCKKDQDLMRTQLDNSRERLMLRHIVGIANFVRNKYPGTNVLMWHDMLNNVDDAMMKQFKLGEVVEPVVWAYAENLQSYLYPDMWQRFSETFPYIWGGSAFKGADGPSRYYSNIPHYLLNHQSWIQQMTDYYKPFKQFRGLIMTGWQRFDHFAILCEVFPVGIPSMAINLMTINNGEYNRNVVSSTSRILQCSSSLDIDTPGIAAFCKFPGSGVYQQVQQLRMTLTNIETELYNDFQVRGWLSRFNIAHNYSSAWYLDQILDKVNMYYNDLDGIRKNLQTEMLPIFQQDTIDEFIFEYIQPDLDKMAEMRNAAMLINGIKTFPGRPFPIKGATSMTAKDSKDKTARRRKVFKSGDLVNSKF